MGSCNLPRATDQTAPDPSPPRMAGGLRAGGPGRGKGDHQLHPQEVTREQKAEAAGQGPIRCTGGEQRADQAAATRTDRSQADRRLASQADRRAGRRRQTDSCAAVRHTQEEAGRPSAPSRRSLGRGAGGPPEAAPAVEPQPRAQSGEEPADVVEPSRRPRPRSGRPRPRGGRKAGGAGPGGGADGPGGGALGPPKVAC